jgi:hypothetical protein
MRPPSASVKLLSVKGYLNAALRYFVPTEQLPLTLKMKLTSQRGFDAGMKKVVFWSQRNYPRRL